MKRFFNLIGFVFLITLVSLFATYLVDNVIEVKSLSLSTLNSIVTIITSVILLAVGIDLYQKFNGSQSLVDKQTERTIELLTFLNTLNFSVELMSARTNISMYNIHITDYTERRLKLNELEKDIGKFKQVFNYRMFGMEQKLGEYARDPYIPRTLALVISENIEYITAEALVPPKDKLFIVGVQGLYIPVPPVVLHDDGTTTEDFVSLNESVNGEKFSLDDLMLKLKAIYNASYDW